MQNSASGGDRPASARPCAPALRQEYYTQDHIEDSRNPDQPGQDVLDTWLDLAAAEDEGLHPRLWGGWADAFRYELTRGSEVEL